jgi:DNA-binding MarR family transcriptional regulator
MKLNRILDVNPTVDAYRVSFLTNRYLAPLNKELASRYGLVWHEWVIVFCLAQAKDLTGKDISEATGRPQNTISDGIRNLLKHGLVRREPNATDGRSMILHLSPKGGALYRAMLPRLRRQQERIFGILTRPERKQLDRLLHKLVHAVSMDKEGPSK